MIGIGDHARQPRRIEDAFLEVELPGAVLLRHQPTLQPVGEPRDDALQMRELLVEVAAQPFQFVMVAEIFGRDHLVELRRKGVIFRPARLVGTARIRPRRLARRLVVAEFAVVERIAGGGLRALHRTLRHFVGGGLRLVGAHFLRGIGIRRALGAGLVALAVLILVVLVVIGVRIAVVAEIERRQQVMHEIAEPRLVLGDAAELVEPSADLVFQHRPPEVDHLFRGRRRREARQPFAHQHRQRVRQRRIGAVGDLVIFAAMEMIVEHRGQVLCNARHPARADRLDARLLHRLEYAARLRISRYQLAVHLGIVTGELERDRVGMAAHDGRIAFGHLAGRLRQPRLARRETRTLGRKRHFQLRRPCDRTQARGYRALERLGRGFLGSGTEFGVGCRHCHLTAVVPANAGTHNHRRLLFCRSLAPSSYRNAAAYGSPRPVRDCALGGDDDYESATFTELSGNSALKQR